MGPKCSWTGRRRGRGQPDARATTSKPARLEELHAPAAQQLATFMFERGLTADFSGWIDTDLRDFEEEVEQHLVMWCREARRLHDILNRDLANETYSRAHPFGNCGKI